MGWSLRGEYVENCNCDLFCPCLLGPRDSLRALPMATPTAGHCDLPAIFHVEAGIFDGSVPPRPGTGVTEFRETH